jgi:hypothetical protein
MLRFADPIAVNSVDCAVDDIVEKIRIGSAQLRQQKVKNREVAGVDVSYQYNCRRKTQKTLSERHNPKEPNIHSKLFATMPEPSTCQPRPRHRSTYHQQR